MNYDPSMNFFMNLQLGLKTMNLIVFGISNNYKFRWSKIMWPLPIWHDLYLFEEEEEMKMINLALNTHPKILSKNKRKWRLSRKNKSFVKFWLIP